MALDTTKAHAVFESTNMFSTKYAARIYDCVCDEDIDNGTFGYLEKMTENIKLYKFVKGVKEGERILVADQPAWDEDESHRFNQLRKNFFIPAGTPFRARVVVVDDKFAITIEGISEDTKATVEGVKNFIDEPVYLTIGEDGKLVASTSSTEGTAMEAVIEHKRIHGRQLVTPLRQYGSTYGIYEARITVLA